MDAHLIGQFIGAIGRPLFEDLYCELVAQTLDAAACSAFTFDEAGQPCSIIAHCAFPMHLWTRFPERDGHAIEIRGVKPQASGGLKPAAANEDFADVVVRCHHDGARYDLSFHRDAPFDTGALDEVRALSEVVVPAMALHMALMSGRTQDTGVEAQADRCDTPIAETMDHLTAVLLAEENRLSPREAEICAAVVLGYRTLAISINCGISENTVRTHRKRAYAKLGITSQNELFSRYFRIVAGMGGGEPEMMQADMRRFSGMGHPMRDKFVPQPVCA